MATMQSTLARLAQIRLERGDISEIAYRQCLSAAESGDVARIQGRIEMLENDFPVRITM